MYEYFMPEEMKRWNDLLLIHKFAVEEIYTRLKILDEEFKNILIPFQKAGSFSP